MIKKIRIIFLWLIAPILLALILLYLMVSTTLGLQTIFYLAKGALPGKIKIQALNGAIIHGFSGQNIVYEYQGNIIRINHLSLHLNLFRLLQRRIFAFNNINASDVTVYISSSSTDNKTYYSINDIISIFKTLKFISIKDLNIDKLTLIHNKNIAFFTELQLTKKNSTQHLFLIKTGSDLLTGSYQISWLPNFNLSMQFYGRLQKQNIQGETNLEFDKNNWQIKKFKLDFGDSKMDLTGIVNKGNTNLNWYISIPNLRQFSPTISGSLFSKGIISQKSQGYYADAEIKANKISTKSFSIEQIYGKLSSTLTNRLANLNLNFNNISTDQYRIARLQSFASLRFNAKDLTSNFNAAFDNRNSLSGNITIKDFSLTKGLEQAVNGRINLFLPLKNFIKMKSIKEIGGNIVGSVDLNGVLNQIKYSGTLNIRRGQFIIRRLGIKPHAIEVTATINQTKPVVIRGEFISGSGRGRLSGEIDIYQYNMPFRLKLTGDNLQIMNFENYKITFSPQLMLTKVDNHLNIIGKILIPYLQITPDQLNNVVKLPSEVVFINGEDADSFPTRLSMRIRLILGKHIIIDYKNLHASVGGTIVVNQVLGGLPTGFGTLYIVEGSYEIYNQLLRIQNGRLIYLGNLISNPGLNIQAWKVMKAQGFGQVLSDHDEKSAVRVGASVQGTLDHPEVRLIADPPMSQDDILAYFVFGAPGNQLSGGNLALLGALASGLNILGPNAGDADESESGLGGMLNVFKVGVFSPMQALNFRRNISKHWLIRTETSPVETGADIMYEYEHN